MESIISIVFSGVLGSLLTYFFGVRKLRTEAELRIKTERYENLIKYLSGFTGRAANADTKRKFFSEWEKSWLYCSGGEGETKLGRGEMQVLLRAQGVRKLEHGKGVDGTFRLRVRYRGRHFFCTGMDSMASLFPRRRAG